MHLLDSLVSNTRNKAQIQDMNERNFSSSCHHNQKQRVESSQPKPPSTKTDPAEKESIKHKFTRHLKSSDTVLPQVPGKPEEKVTPIEPLLESISFIYLDPNSKAGNAAQNPNEMQTLQGSAPLTQEAIEEEHFNFSEIHNANEFSLHFPIEEAAKDSKAPGELDLFHEMHKRKDYSSNSENPLNFTSPEWAQFKQENIIFPSSPGKESAKTSGPISLNEKTDFLRASQATPIVLLQEKETPFLKKIDFLSAQYQREFSALDIPQNPQVLDKAPLASTAHIEEAMLGDMESGSEITLDKKAATPLTDAHNNFLNLADKQEGHFTQAEHMKEHLEKQFNSNDIILSKPEDQGNKPSHSMTTSTISQIHQAQSSHMVMKETSLDSIAEAGDQGEMQNPSSLIGKQSVNVLATPATTAKTSPTATQSLYHQNPSTMQQIAFSIKTGLAEGKDRMTVQLKPESLGRVDIKIDVALDGRAVVIVATEQSETYDLFRQDSKQLMDQLTDAGFNLDSGDITYNMLDHHPANDQQEDQDAHPKHNRASDEQEITHATSDSERLIMPHHNGIWNTVA